jgi:ribosome-binding ATPase YchF (GTP1/OBG family)
MNELNNLYEKKEIEISGLLSLKPSLYVCNVDEESISKGNQYTRKFIEKFGEKNTIIISAEIENQLNSLIDKEKANYMEMLGIKEEGIKRLSKKGYNLLNLETFFTSGPEESRAWTINKNCLAPSAAGKIHTDFEKGFIKVETISYRDFVDNKGWLNSKNNGKMRLEGKEYIVKDGDVLNFRFNT